MAYLIKNSNRSSGSGPSKQGSSVVDQLIQVTRAAKALPQSTTQQLFRVRGGRVLVRLLLGTVTTIIQSTDPVAKISSKQLDAASVAVGTAVDIASTADLSSLEVGGSVTVEGDGTAIVLANAGCSLLGAPIGSWVAPQGEIYLTTGASKTGAFKWDLWYEPLDPGAYVEAIDAATAAI